jgi:allophanate hydrolase subunit 1
MVYGEPVFHIGGDSFLTVELGDDGSLFLNIYILTLEKMIWEAEFPWLIDTTALRTTIMVHYDPFVAQAGDVTETLKSLILGGVRVPEKVPSKIIHLPVYYDDPWTKACAREYGLSANLEIVAKENEISTEEVIRIHSQPAYFVSYTSFMYGSFGAFPMAPFTVLKNSKYKVPRKWTPPGTLGIGGTTTTFYSIVSPGGLMMLGNSPVKTFDLDRQNPFFESDPLLVHPGDRLRFFPIKSKAYDQIKRHRDDYRYDVE